MTIDAGHVLARNAADVTTAADPVNETRVVVLVAGMKTRKPPPPQESNPVVQYDGATILPVVVGSSNRVYGPRVF